MENMVKKAFWRGKKVFITGHTGFKGSWLGFWLLHLGAEVKGLSLAPNTTPALFEQLDLAQNLSHHIGDIREAELVTRLIASWQPDVVFHLAAQPLVRLSYLESVETWNTNVMGTIHVLEALKSLTHPCAAVFITSDKCYENREWVYGYRENDPLGGYDPYSSSKAGAELAIASWRNSFFKTPQTPIGIASARAGNVIGGGDWSLDRIVPDAMRALMKSEAIPVRNPLATRPWQHVLEPLGGYLRLAESIYEQLMTANWQQDSRGLYGAFNFGPALASNRPVKELVESILQLWPGTWLDQSDPNAVHEAKLLNLVTDKAFHTLKWQPVWDFRQTLKETVTWYYQAAQMDSQDKAQFQELTRQQIEYYQSCLSD
ncbi:CDP-glucose 4,6-dehydratase [Microcystis viridis NIES-102]|uniref:CDP-glucose 4,6-dehydratase n=1 Tax=Microcystis viridis NIES-102 TaxID=213615 RepID=A0A3G9K6X6_MICVR|nr:CDP-glucose 4,6-dehydratase [Microcystis viridis]BBH41875.1 CDP-glucose 4,6-dehydratase [Microcystis viridis NIES-102]